MNLQIKILGRLIDPSTLVIKYVSCVYKDNGPWPVVAAVVAGESPSNPKTDLLLSFWISRKKNCAIRPRLWWTAGPAMFVLTLQLTPTRLL